MSNEDQAVRAVRQGQLAARLREEVEDILDREETRIVNQVMVKLNAGETLDPQFAVQQWLALHSSRAFRRTLAQRERQVASAGRKLADSLTKAE